MTNREAYERDCNELEQYREIGTVEQVRNQKHNLEMAYKIISDYEAIGTVEECRKAVEKLSVKIVSDLDYDLGYYTCPSCGIAISFMDDGHKSHKCCLNCGQVIQFYENLEGMEDE